MIWILLIAFQFKHFIADYPLQTPYMLGKFKDKGWVTPLACHCGVQASFTYLIALFALPSGPKFAGYAFGLFILDFTIHFIMDRIKASPKMLGRYEAFSKEQFKGLTEARSLAVSAFNENFSGAPWADVARDQASKEIIRIDKKFESNKYFWWALGLDQMVHHLTDILLIFLIMKTI